MQPSQPNPWDASLARPGGRCFLWQGAINFFHFFQSISKQLLCEAQGCNQCRICQSITANQNLQCYTLVGEPGESRIKIDSIRDAMNWLHQYPNEGKYKILSMYDVSCLQTAAVNACLKGLEELPDYAVVLLGTANANQLLPTLRSRCLSYQSPSVSFSDYIQSHEKDTHPSTRLAQVWCAALAQPVLADRYLQDEGLCQHLEQWIGYLLGNSRRYSVGDAACLVKGELLPGLSCLLFLLTELIKCQSSPPRIWFTLYDEWLVLYADVRRGVAYRESSVLPLVLQQWYTHVPSEIAKVIGEKYGVN